MSVLSRKLLRSAVYLFGVLTAIAGFYFLVGYHFLGAVQLTVYAGGIVVLIIFSILLTHEIDHQMPNPGWGRMAMAGALSIGGALMVVQLLKGSILNRVESPEQSDLQTVGTALLNPGQGGYLLPFEVVSVLLLAAMIGAIVIAKHKLSTDNSSPEKQTP